MDVIQLKKSIFETDFNGGNKNTIMHYEWLILHIYTIRYNEHFLFPLDEYEYDSAPSR